MSDVVLNKESISDVALTEEKEQKMNKKDITKEKNIKKVFSKVLFYTVFMGFTVLIVFPMVWLGYSSFKSRAEVMRDALALPTTLRIGNYFEAWTVGHMGQYMINSFIYATVSTGVLIFLAMMVSFAFAKIRYKIVTSFLWYTFLLGLLITLQAILIPLFLFEIKIGLYDTHLGVIIIYIAIGLPLAILLGTEFIKGIPDSIIESAKIDGASYFQIFLKIILPICKPVIVTIAIISILGCWNEFLLASILTSRHATRPLPVGVYMFSSPLSMNYGVQFAALVIALFPILVFYIIFHKQITRGLVAGAIK